MTVHVENFGKMTPQQVLLDVEAYLDDIDEVVVIIRRGKRTNAVWSDGEHLRLLGMIEVARDSLLKRMRP